MVVMFSEAHLLIDLVFLFPSFAINVFRGFSIEKGECLKFFLVCQHTRGCAQMMKWFPHGFEKDEEGGHESRTRVQC